MATKDMLAKMKAKSQQTDKQNILKQQTNNKFRLPHQTHIEADYDATIQKWHITLTIGDQQYKVVANGLHWGFQKVGKMWWSKNSPKDN